MSSGQTMFQRALKHPWLHLRHHDDNGTVLRGQFRVARSVHRSLSEKDRSDLGQLEQARAHEASIDVAAIAPPLPSVPVSASGIPASHDCTASWDKQATGTANNKRITLVVHFQQGSSGPYNITTLDVGVTKVQRKVLGFWINTTADYIILSGQFGGPRSPRDQFGNYGYHLSNPFYINYSGHVRHFTDYSATSLDCYTMSAANYFAIAYFGGVGTSVTVSW